MKTTQWETSKILNRIDELKQDERLTYPDANVFTNAPLAIIQIALKTELNTLERVAGLNISRFPLKSAQKNKS
jgi:hypothetical protein